MYRICFILYFLKSSIQGITMAITYIAYTMVAELMITDFHTAICITTAICIVIPSILFCHLDRWNGCTTQYIQEFEHSSQCPSNHIQCRQKNDTSGFFYDCQTQCCKGLIACLQVLPCAAKPGINNAHSDDKSCSNQLSECNRMEKCSLL